MCGIFLTANRARLLTPGFITQTNDCSPSLRCLESKEYEFSSSEILVILDNCLSNETKLSEADARKLKNVELLRELQTKLAKAKNSKDASKLLQVQKEIDSLSSSDDVEVGPIPGDATSLMLKRVLARGPDYAKFREFQSGGTSFQLLSSVLSLRQPFTPQPLELEDVILQFNGELYNEVCIDGNDTRFVFERLEEAFAVYQSRKEAILEVLSSLNGEFALVITDLKNQVVYFGKDNIGKRSLLFELKSDSLTLTSVSAGYDLDAVECKNSCLYVVDLSNYSLDVVPYYRQNEVSFLPGSAVDDIVPKLELRLKRFHLRLQTACSVRQRAIQPLHPSAEHLDLAILFSGGLDCTVLARLIASNYAQSRTCAIIDLLTVGFENPRTGLGPNESPDRKLSERSWFELANQFHGSGVKFRLVQIDVSYAEWLAHRRRVLEHIYPCSTEMDLSIAIAFYFACRASNCNAIEVSTSLAGVTWDSFLANTTKYTTITPNYKSGAKVLFSGLGADELFGGYSRHENIFSDLQEGCDTNLLSSRYDELSLSLKHDIDVIYERNLGRDDRAMSTWGKELRYPFLDTEVVRFVMSEVEPHYKVKYDWVTTTTKKGDKRMKKFERKNLLRELARSIGLPMAAEEVKRAIQFGAKSAKLEVGQGKTRGTDLT